MSRPPLPPEKRRRPVSLSLSRAAIELLDGYVALGHADTRSRAAERAINEWFEMTRERPRARTSSKE